ncbi:acetoin ABC transporter permease [Bacillus pseudomycoides]|uniref:Acetoin ABC transporter permease n=1 Tax=Bacillus pseudomycoides TaxID=64104 RepID=A0AA91ZTC5_9BACI|nr:MULTISPECIES: ABC transporter permease subunit [Bacillus]PEB53179.1 acetoin ABC transporter permease [Bacillus sp. AFS098217]PED82227.1 acetoin ABC transporter permease [Bacillus pseudomycoides]PEU13447.1 acetoin ABC transporter permease [Bacillus sp. AFS014408]PEU14573.1 acetoin ABC transporter permease [Bacillus sp. AFS019443]PFW61717.1 acetoin ABC transporter permease [Bacillus sp. AFS075034]
MFHKALWMWNWKRGKYAVLLFFLSTLYYLSYRYYKAAQQQLANYYKLQEKGTFYYDYAFWSGNSSFWLTIFIIFLACLLIGWERSNQSNTLLMAMPFKRKDVFLSKWAFGSFCIVGSFLINWILMYFIYKTTIHFDYQSFGPFHRYFLYAIVSYVAVYTAALCIGTFTGGVVSQVVFCIPWLLMGLTFISLLYNFTINHFDATNNRNSHLYESLSEINKKTNIVAPIYNFSINYYYNPEGRKKEHDPTTLRDPAHHTYYSPKSVLVPIFYTIFYLLLGTYLYKRSPNENCQKIFIFQKHLRIWIWGTTIYFALLGGYKINQFSFLFNYYIGMLFAGIITYFVLSRLTNYKVF